MITKIDKNAVRQRRHARVRKTITGTAETPRMNVYRSLNHIYVQIIDDRKGDNKGGVTLAAASTMDKEVKEKIADTYAKTGYVMDTHTAVAASVYERYAKESGDTRKTVIASTASPYKFARSVMTSIDEKYDEVEEFDLIDTLEVLSGVDAPKAIEEIRNAKILHTLECDADKMEETVKKILIN